MTPLKIKLREIRKEIGLTQEELAKKLNIKPSQLSQIENGKYYPSLKNLLLLSRALSKVAGKSITVNDLYELERADLD